MTTWRTFLWSYLVVSSGVLILPSVVRSQATTIKSNCLTLIQVSLKDAEAAHGSEFKPFFSAKVFDANIDEVCLALMLYESPDVNEAFKRAARLSLAKSWFAAAAGTTQQGANASAAGSTNLVSKNFSAQTLSLASEYAGVKQSTSGQTTTLSGSLAGVPLSIASKTGMQALVPCAGAVGGCLHDGLLNALSRVSFAVAVDAVGTGNTTGKATAGQGSTQPVKLTSVGTSRPYNVSEVTGKVSLRRCRLNNQDVLAALDASAYSQLEGNATNLRKLLLDAYDPNNSRPNANIISATEELASTPVGKEGDAWQKAALLYYKVVSREPGFAEAVAQYLLSAGEFTAKEEAAIEQARKPAFSFEYDLNRPANQPSSSTFKLILSFQKDRKNSSPLSSNAPAPESNGLTFTFNAAASIYNSQPSASISSAGLLRDVQVAGETDYGFRQNLFGVQLFGPPTLSGAFYYQDQTSPAILNVPINSLPITGLAPSTNQVFGRKGSIDIGQVKLSLGSASSGWRVPLSFTVTNRTELLQGMDVKGQVGISYNFDSLFSK